jgi:hypothetical protein
LRKMAQSRQPCVDAVPGGRRHAFSWLISRSLTETRRPGPHCLSHSSIAPYARSPRYVDPTGSFASFALSPNPTATAYPENGFVMKASKITGKALCVIGLR